MDEILQSSEAFRALNAWAKAPSRGVRSDGGLAGFGYLQLHFRPDDRGPEVQVTLRAALVGGRPVIQVQSSAPPPTVTRPEPVLESSLRVVVVGPEPDERLGRDPSAVCEACGVVGTVGRAVRTDRTGAVIEAHRFCFDCWPEQSARYRARWMEEIRRARQRLFRRLEPAVPNGGQGMAFEAATWHTTVDMVRRIEATMTAPAPPAPPSPEELEQIAAQIAANAPQLEGEMPFEVEMFIRRYGRS